MKMKIVNRFSTVMFFTFLVNIAMSQTIGLQLYSLREQFKNDIPATLKQIHEWHISEIEGGGTYGLSKESFKQLLMKNELKMVSVGADFEQLEKDPTAAVEEAKSYGAKYIVCFWIPHKGDDFTINDIRKAADVFNKAGKMISEKGLNLCYHPHGYEFRPFENGTQFDYLVNNTNPKYLNFEMDVFWVKQPGQDPAALLRKYPERFLMLHLKDRKIGTEGNQNGHAEDASNVVLGQGDVDIKSIVKEAKKRGIKHCFIEDESPTSLKQIPLSLKFLNSLNKK
ncbi:MAG: sugar phosphate isomerase/epimerase [Ginsengibacter sp.]